MHGYRKIAPLPLDAGPARASSLFGLHLAVFLLVFSPRTQRERGAHGEEQAPPRRPLSHSLQAPLLFFVFGIYNALPHFTTLHVTLRLHFRVVVESLAAMHPLRCRLAALAGSQPMLPMDNSPPRSQIAPARVTRIWDIRRIREKLAPYGMLIHDWPRLISSPEVGEDP